MSRTILLSLCLIAALPAEAGEDTGRIRVLGFTADGNFLAYLPPVQLEVLGEEDDESYISTNMAVVKDLRTGKTQEYLLKLDENEQREPSKATRKRRAELLRRYKALPGKAAWTAWQKENPARCVSGKQSPDGKVQVNFKIKGKVKGISGAWGKRDYEFSDLSECCVEAESGATLTELLVLDGKPAVADSLEMRAETTRMNGDVRTCWSPDSRWLAWSLHREPPMLRTPPENEIHVEQLSRPRLQLVVHKDVREAVARVSPILEQAGYRVAGSKESNQADGRRATVVYAAPGYEKTARALAARIPGGATVAKMDWRAAFDIVVGIGKSALAGQ